MPVILAILLIALILAASLWGAIFILGLMCFADVAEAALVSSILVAVFAGLAAVIGALGWVIPAIWAHAR